MPTPVILPAPVIMHHSNYSSRPMTHNDWKLLAAFWIALHLFPLIVILFSSIVDLFKKDKYYDTFDNNEFSWLLLLILFSADFLGMITYWVYQIL